MTSLESPRTQYSRQRESLRHHGVVPRTDSQLLSATLEFDDHDAFGEFYLRHANRLFGYFRQRCAGPQDAYDLVAETFAQALQSLAEFDGDRGEPIGWLFGIAKNKHRRYARNGAVETRARERLTLNVSRLSNDSVDQLDEIIDLETVRNRLEPAIAELAPSIGAAIRLRCLDELDYDDIAARLGIRPAAARKRVSRGLRQLEDVIGNNPFTTNHD